MASEVERSIAPIRSRFKADLKKPDRWNRIVSSVQEKISNKSLRDYGEHAIIGTAVGAVVRGAIASTGVSGIALAALASGGLAAAREYHKQIQYIQRTDIQETEISPPKKSFTDKLKEPFLEASAFRSLNKEAWTRVAISAGVGATFGAFGSYFIGESIAELEPIKAARETIAENVLGVFGGMGQWLESWRLPVETPVPALDQIQTMEPLTLPIEPEVEPEEVFIPAEAVIETISEPVEVFASESTPIPSIVTLQANSNPTHAINNFVQELLGRKLRPEESLSIIKEVVQSSDIAVEEWGIGGRFSDRNLPVGFEFTINDYVKEKILSLA